MDSNAGIACLAWASSDADKIEIFLFSTQCPRGCHRHCLSSLKSFYLTGEGKEIKKRRKTERAPELISV